MITLKLWQTHKHTPIRTPTDICIYMWLSQAINRMSQLNATANNHKSDAMITVPVKLWQTHRSEQQKQQQKPAGVWTRKTGSWKVKEGERPESWVFVHIQSPDNWIENPFKLEFNTLVSPIWHTGLYAATAFTTFSITPTTIISWTHNRKVKRSSNFISSTLLYELCSTSAKKNNYFRTQIANKISISSNSWAGGT